MFNKTKKLNAEIAVLKTNLIGALEDKKETRRMNYELSEQCQAKDKWISELLDKIEEQELEILLG